MKKLLSGLLIVVLVCVLAAPVAMGTVTYDSDKTVIRNQIDALIALANAVGSNIATADVLWVDGDRSDSYTETGSLGAPYKTIQAADTASVSGDVILVAPGAYSETVTLNAGVHLFGWNVTGATLTGEYIIFKGATIEFSGNLVMENGEIIDNSSDGTIAMDGALDVSGGDITLENDEYISNATNGQIDLAGAVNVLPGTTGGLLLTVQEVTPSITADASITVDLTIPTGSMIVGVQYQVETALAATETWDASFNDGSELWEFADDVAVAQNTEGSAFWPVNTATNITDADTNIVIDGNGATGAFTAQGQIRFIIYYYDFSAMADAS